MNVVVPTESGGTMKILFLAPFGIRPKGTLIARMLPLAVEMQSLGHTVVIVAPPYTNPEDSGRTEVVNGVTIRNIQLGPKNKVLAAPFLAWRMFKALLREKPDLVHLFKPKGYGGLAAMLLVVLSRIGLRLPPLLVDTDDWEGRGGMNELHAYSSLEKRFYEFQEAWLLRNAVAVTVASRGLEMICLDKGVSPERTMYLPNCVSAKEPGNGSGIRQRLGIDPAAPVVLLYTRFFEFDQSRLYQVFAAVQRIMPNVSFLVVGKGRSGEEHFLKLAAEKQGFAKGLVMAGWIEPQELPSYLLAADVAIYPLDDNTVNRCKCPAKLTEIILTGLPVVADCVGQAEEYIIDGVSGVLCSPLDPEKMATEVVRLLNDPDKRLEMGLTGRAHLLAHFSWNKYASSLVEYYMEQVKK